MNTPIYDFAGKYAQSDAVRMHMPGHKGKPLLGCEPLDLTEIHGADELYAPAGIIAESEANVSKLFGCQTLYSTEGSSLCIRAMLWLAMKYAASCGHKPLIYAVRNVHKSFLTTVALLDIPIKWIPQDCTKSYLSSAIDWLQSETFAASDDAPTALYLTSPDYLGNMADIRRAAAFCHAHHMLLLVDNAHGAYLKFLPQSLHPIDLGADLCCDSAHKTLPVLTGGGYLHIADHAPEICSRYAKNAMAMFASTSPSYLILESLDLCNRYLAEQFPADLQALTRQVCKLKQELKAHSWMMTGDEPTKLTIMPKSRGHSGINLAKELENQRIYVEFADPDYAVLMLSPQNDPREITYLRDVLCALPQHTPLTDTPPIISQQKAVMHPHELMYADAEVLPITDCKGRICAEFAVSCPPAVPIVMCGERISEEAVCAMQYYGIQRCTVLK